MTLEEGTWAAWLYDMLKPHVKEIVVCNPRRNAFLKEGSKSDKVDARKLAELLGSGMLRGVYHGENGLRTLRELARSYLAISKDLNRVMNRLKALYRGWGILCTGTQVYTRRHREQWLRRLRRRRAPPSRAVVSAVGWTAGFAAHSARRTFSRESETSGCENIAPGSFDRPASGRQLLALIQTPYRFRSKRQLWTYSGLGVETHDSAQHRYVDGQLQRSKKPQQIRGLNQNHNHDMKNIFKSTALSATGRAAPLQDFYEGLLAKGMKPEMARLTLARKIAAITLTLWKKGGRFDAEHLKSQAA